jgi:site-specific recombinase XerD
MEDFQVRPRFSKNTPVSKFSTKLMGHSSLAVEFLHNGGNVFELKRILGHEKLETVEVYLELASVDIQRAQQANSPADR